MKLSNLHTYISNKIVFLLDCIYYNNLKKLYPENDLKDILILKKFPIIKPDYFIFLQYYFIYKFFNNLTYNNLFRYSFFLHFYHINGLVFHGLSNLYKYQSSYNITYLKEISDYLFLYLFFFKILYLNIISYKKGIMIIFFMFFYLFFSINELYKARLKSIEKKEDFNHPFKILIVTPNKKNIENIILKTNLFTYTNFLFFINVFLFLFV
jgi:hypothetical protein